MFAASDHRSMNMCGPKMKLVREWGKLSNEEFHDFIFPPNICKKVKARQQRVDGRVALKAEMANFYKYSF
jgi:hypothetical protein